MKHILHYAKKDLTRHWLLALLVLVAIAFDAIDVRYALVQWQYNNFESGILMAFLKWPICFLFAVAVTQEDVVVGEKTFWLTRPVHPLVLLSSKLVSVFAVVVVPQTLAHLALALAFATTPAVVTAIGVETFVTTGLVALVAVLFAALTRSVLQSCLLVVISAIAAITVGLLYVNFAPEFVKWVLGYSRVSVGTRFVALAVLLGVMLPALLAQHYVRRRAARTGVLAAVLGGCGVVLACIFPFDLIPQPYGGRDFSEARTPQPTKIEFKVAGDVTAGGSWRRLDRVTREARNQTLIVLPVRTNFDRNDRVIHAAGTTTTIHHRDGHDEVREIVGGSYFGWRQHARALYAAAGLPYREQKNVAPRFDRLALFAVNPSTNPIPPGQPADLSVRVEYYESEFKLAQRVPFKLHTSFTLDGLPYEIDRLETSELGVATLWLRRVGVTSLLRPEAGARPDNFVFRPPSNRQIEVMLRNTKTEEFATGGVESSVGPASPGMFAISKARCAFTAPRRVDSGRPSSRQLDAEWLANAELLIYTIHPLGKSVQTVQLKNVSIDIEEQPAVQFW